MKPPKPKTCVVCKKKFRPNRSLQKVCGYDCAIVDAKAKTEKKIRSDLRKEKKELAERFEIKKKADYENDLQKLVNKIARQIDKGHACISSGRKTGQFHGGHYISRGSNPTIRFHLMNIYGQTAMDNNHLSGNPIGYREGLISNFGQAHFDYVENLKSHPTINLTVDDLKEKIKAAKFLVKESALLPVLNNDERLFWRQKFNEILGIYKF